MSEGLLLAAACAVPRGGVAPQCLDDAAWLFSGIINCSSFAVTPGAARCEESWAVGAAAGGAQRVAYEACEVSCPRTATPRSCWLVPPSCGDTDGDGSADGFDCVSQSLARDTAATVACADDAACVASECLFKQKQCSHRLPAPQAFIGLPGRVLQLH